MTAKEPDTRAQHPETNDEVIESVAFQPVSDQLPHRRWRPTPVIVTAAIALALAAAVMIYLFSAKSLYIRTNAEQPSVTIDGLLTFALADHFLLLRGSHELQASADGYFPTTTTIEVTEATTQYLDITLQPMPGHLTVTTNAPAQVYIDGQLMGVSGERLSPIEPGLHQLQLLAERYQPLRQDITIEGLDQHQTLDLQLAPNWADISVASEPAGATLSVDGQAVGETPITAQLLAGKHTLQLQLPGHKSWQHVLRVSAQTAETLPVVTLQKADGLITLNTTPSGANITIDGQFYGRTPLQVELAPEQKYSLTLLKEGYQPLHASLSPQSGAEQALSYSLKPTLGDIQISATPEDALLYVDGVLMGRANQTVSLPTRQHRIRISKSGYADHSATVLPRGGLQQKLSVQLLTEEEYKWKNIPPQLLTAAQQKLLLFKPNDRFSMGASRREQGRRANEAQHTVVLNKAFYLGERLVSNGEYRQFDRFHSSGHVQGNSLNGDDQPAVNLSWQQAALYCNWLSERDQLPPFYQVENGVVTGFEPAAKGYRLATEAEWAWAARRRDGAMLKYAWGDQLPPAKGSGNFGDRSAAKLLGNILFDYDDGYAVTAPSTAFPPNHNQLYDISGNAAEWINDYYGIKTGLSQQVEENPMGPEKGDYHVIRGSSWAHATMTDLRLSYRDYGSAARNDVGFRIARYVE
ncbi:PEGA domain-containing protein [Pseudomaricurvus alcaniphilus]|uniref:PEGA domain-containing protein n=1 Tax=Pseudomaricurvus alcaniphilus TaxID=1166482 RepID=UPI00140A296C|nr:PEGA domain-containing protein [Pseudomaricurvus alcaniphilus]NHN37694.1 PEGA domain-containing protein [Pseudomaricurvus alcaniphilus]